MSAPIARNGEATKTLAFAVWYISRAVRPDVLSSPLMGTELVRNLSSAGVRHPSSLVL